MRRPLVILFAVLLTGSGAYAQLLTEVPLFPRDTDSVEIIADCSKGNQGLFNYANTGDVYVHIGLITSASSGPADWKYAPFTWGTTPSLAKAVSLGNNRYRYSIGNIRSFFNVSAGETILRIAILFRNGSGSLAQRNSDGGDMYVPVYANSLAARFVLPPFQPKYDPVPEPINKLTGDSLVVKYTTNKAGALTIAFNGVNLASAANADSLQATLHITQPGSQ